MAREFLDGFYIGTGPGQPGYCGMTHCVRCYHARIHFGTGHRPPEGFDDPVHVTSFCHWIWKDPSARIACHLSFADKSFCDSTRQWLFAPLATLDLHPKSSTRYIKIIEPRTKYFAVS